MENQEKSVQKSDSTSVSVAQGTNSKNFKNSISSFLIKLAADIRRNAIRNFIKLLMTYFNSINSDSF